MGYAKAVLFSKNLLTLDHFGAKCNQKCNNYKISSKKSFQSSRAYNLVQKIGSNKLVKDLMFTLNVRTNYFSLTGTEDPEYFKK